MLVKDVAWLPVVIVAAIVASATSTSCQGPREARTKKNHCASLVRISREYASSSLKGRGPTCRGDEMCAELLVLHAFALTGVETVMEVAA